MDKAQIIDNGILEQYVLGELNASEQGRVEAAISHDPALKTTLAAIELSFERLAFENAIKAPDAVKIELLKNIKQETTKTIPLPNTNEKRFYLNIAASAAAILCVVSIYLLTQLNSTNKALKIAQENNTELNDNFKNLNEQLVETSQWYEAINDPDSEKYVLKGNSLMPEGIIISYVNDAKKSILINTEQLPKLDAEHDYQMWADVDGEMIDMGVINKEGSMLAMNYIDNAKSLNITIEPAGGNDHPTVSQLVTNVYLR